MRRSDLKRFYLSLTWKRYVLDLLISPIALKFKAMGMQVSFAQAIFLEVCCLVLRGGGITLPQHECQ